jgi:hypothetical protein
VRWAAPPAGIADAPYAAERADTGWFERR